MKYIAISQPGGPEVLQIREGEIPTIGEHEVLIEVKAAGVNRPDILQRRGLYPMPEGVTPVPGLEVAGVVVKVAQVTAFTPGDRVCALTNGGGCAEYCAVPQARRCRSRRVSALAKRPPFRKPSSPSGRMSSSWVSCSPAKDSGPRRRQRIGTTAVLLCHALGMTVYATVGRRKIAALRPYATAINYKTDDFAEKIGQLTNDEGVDVILILLAALTLTATLGY